MNGKRRYCAQVGIAMLAFALRMYGLTTQSLWRDEVDAVRFAIQPLSGVMGMFVRAGQNGPLYYLVLRPWLYLVGHGEFALRFFSVVFGVLSVLLLYSVARRLFPRLPLVALLASLFAATSPYLIWYSKEGKMYSLVVFASLLSMDRFLIAVQKGGWVRWLTYAVVTGAAFYIHLVSVLVIPAQALVILSMWERRQSLTWKAAVTGLAIVAAVYLPILVWELPLLSQPAYIGYDFVALPEMVTSLLISYTLGVIQPANWWNLVPAIGLCLAGVVLGIRDSRPAPILFAVGWVGIPLLLFYLVTLSRPMYTPRYLIFLLPALLTLVALGGVAVWRRSRLVGTLLVGSFLVASGLGFWLQETKPLKADFRAATRFVMERLDRGDLVVFQIPHGRHSFEYYMDWGAPVTPVERASEHSRQAQGQSSVYLPFVAAGTREGYRWADGLYTNAGMDSSEVDLRMEKIVTGSGVVWLVESEAGMWDRRRLVKVWLEDHMVLTDSAEFLSVNAYRYEVP